MRKKSFLIYICLILILFSFPFFSYGACPPGQICIENPLEADSFEDLINAVINFIFYIALGIAPLMVIVAAIYLITAGGNPDNVQKAKDIILYTCIGLLIIFLARALIAVVKAALGG